MHTINNIIINNNNNNNKIYYCTVCGVGGWMMDGWAWC